MDLKDTNRIRSAQDTNALIGSIRWDAGKSVWISTMTLGGVIAILIYSSWGGLLTFLITTAITICAGHSVGMHRLLIHRSFQTNILLEYVLVWLGTIVGMAGPLSMMKLHDMRDWHQRQNKCPSFPAHNAGFWRDAWWQLHCVFVLDNPPIFKPEPEILNDRFYMWLERNWRIQQVFLAIPLYVFGGLGLVLWGICLRVSVSLVGHWLIGHYAHKKGHQGWYIKDLPVQGYNLRGLGLITFGENWHSNHHAFPHSAKLGIEKGQSDPGFWLIKLFALLKLAHSIREPDSEPAQKDLIRIHS